MSGSRRLINRIQGTSVSGNCSYILAKCICLYLSRPQRQPIYEKAVATPKAIFILEKKGFGVGLTAEKRKVLARFDQSIFAICLNERNNLFLNYLEMFQNPLMDGTSNIIKQKREEFRSEIRRRNVESMLSQKRQVQKDAMVETLAIEKEMLLAELQNAMKEKNCLLVHQLHATVFKLSSAEQNDVRDINLEYLIQNNYIVFAYETLKDGIFRSSYCEIFKTLANTCLSQKFYGQDQILLKQVLDLSYKMLMDETLIGQLVADILVFIGNVADQSLELCEVFMRKEVLMKMVDIARIQKNEINALKNICYCILVFSRVLDENQRLTLEQKIIGIRLLLEIMKAPASDFIHYEILCPFTYFYQPDEEIDAVLLANDAIKFLLSTINGEYVDLTLRVVKSISLSENQEIANSLIDNGCLGVIQQCMTRKNQKIRTQAYVILSNLCYNKAHALGKIVNHPITNKILNVLVNENLKEKGYALRCILNLLAAGNDALYKKLIDLVCLNHSNFDQGLIQLLCCLLEQEDAMILKLLLEAIKYIINFGREMKEKEGYETNPMLDRLKQFSIVPQLERLQKHQSVDVQKLVFEVMEQLDKSS